MGRTRSHYAWARSAASRRGRSTAARSSRSAAGRSGSTTAGNRSRRTTRRGRRCAGRNRCAAATAAGVTAATAAAMVMVVAVLMMVVAAAAASTITAAAATAAAAVREQARGRRAWPCDQERRAGQNGQHQSLAKHQRSPHLCEVLRRVNRVEHPSAPGNSMRFSPSSGRLSKKSAQICKSRAGQPT